MTDIIVCNDDNDNDYDVVDEDDDDDGNNADNMKMMVAIKEFSGIQFIFHRIQISWLPISQDYN